ncbi:hypothetical protein ABTZ58_39075 [Streptomyces sp. NPDC094143]|uniref:hypothetical protein n=1 Tax=Streptomyces sp. NPDC094143 TaxID=3155310 RepID=UPI003319A1AF
MAKSDTSGGPPADEDSTAPPPAPLKPQPGAVLHPTKDEAEQAKFDELLAAAAAATGPDEKFELAYDAALTVLTQQDATLTNLRNRASGLSTVAGAIASFAAAIGLVDKENPLPVLILIGLMVTMAAVIACAFMILMPRNWNFGADPAVILTASGEYGEVAKLRRALTVGILPAARKNEQQLQKCARYYRYGVVVLGVEVVLVVVAALVSR